MKISDLFGFKTVIGKWLSKQDSKIEAWIKREVEGTWYEAPVAVCMFLLCVLIVIIIACIVIPIVILILGIIGKLIAFWWKLLL